jgi:hypothetical protein
MEGYRYDTDRATQHTWEKRISEYRAGAGQGVSAMLTESGAATSDAVPTLSTQLRAGQKTKPNPPA